MLYIQFSHNYRRLFQELVNHNPSFLGKTTKVIEIFRKNPTDRRLGIHSLKRRLKGKWALSITGDIRVVFVWINKHRVRFLAIGGHSQVYGRKLQS